jgi:hypothetical protein
MFTNILTGAVSGVLGLNQQPANITVQAPEQNNTPLYIIGGVILVVVVIFAIILIRK